MLLDFTVENFRSVAEEQRLCLSAGRFHSERIGAVMDAGPRAGQHVLRAMAIMGANGSGKSTIIEAFKFLKVFVRDSSQKMQKGDRIAVQAHKLSEELSGSPSKFEIIFVHNSVEYTYSLAVNFHHVVNECLSSRAKGRGVREIFCRNRTDSGEYNWNLGTLPVENARLWQESTRENASFMSTAVQLNSKELADPFEWISTKLKVQTFDSSFDSGGFTSHLISEHIEDGCRRDIINIIRESDLGIRDIAIKSKIFDEDDVPEGMPDEIRKLIVEKLIGETVSTPEFKHRTRDGKIVSFEMDEESDGTRKIYEMAGPIVSAIRHDYVMIIDELDSSLHPLVLRLIISLFQNPNVPDSKAQIIFTTHDDGLLDSKILERDQFVFVEKARGATRLIPLNDYRPRKGEAMRLNYLRGRYGGVPAISRVKVL